MELICAVDLLDGTAVRLVQGDYERRVDVPEGPEELAARFVLAGCRRLHVVDLAGARAGEPRQLELVRRVRDAARGVSPDVHVESGGGLRTVASVDAVLEVVDDALLGTAAIEVDGFLRDCADRHPGRIVASLDLRDGRPALDGWARTGSGDAVALATRLLADGASRIVVTDTSRDGTQAGPNVDLLRTLRQALPEAILVAAGGIGSIDDLRALEAAGCDGAVVGIALITGRIDAAAAIEALA